MNCIKEAVEKGASAVVVNAADFENDNSILSDGSDDNNGQVEIKSLVIMIFFKVNTNSCRFGKQYPKKGKG